MLDFYIIDINEKMDGLSYEEQLEYLNDREDEINEAIEKWKTRLSFVNERKDEIEDERQKRIWDKIEESTKLAPFFTEIKERMTNLNIAILTIQGLSVAHQIGAEFFLKLENYLKSGEKLEADSWKSLWDNHLYGLLFEYLRGLPNAEDDLDTLYRAYTLKDKYRMENKKAIKLPSQDA